MRLRTEHNACSPTLKLRSRPTNELSGRNRRRAARRRIEESGSRCATGGGTLERRVGRLAIHGQASNQAHGVNARLRRSAGLRAARDDLAAALELSNG